VLDPDLVHGLARIATDFALAIIDAAAKIGIDALVLLGDLAGERTTLVSPKHFRQYVKPYHEEIVDLAYQRDLKIVTHSDGNLRSILDDFLEVGFDGIHPIQPQCMEIAEVKEHVDGRACILGNIDCRERALAQSCFGDDSTRTRDFAWGESARDDAHARAMAGIGIAVRQSAATAA
jgi:uroporphyrinogen decarboxylase